MEQLLRRHSQRYPLMEAADALKLLYQRAYGPGHLITEPEKSLKRLQEEMQESIKPPRRVERLGKGFARFYPAGFTERELDLVNRLFIRSASMPVGGEAVFWQDLDTLRKLTDAGELPFSRASLEDCIAAWQAAGCPLFSHSAQYRAAYHPAYRVLYESYARCFLVFSAADQLLRQDRETVTIAIEGGAATGKSTLAAAVAEVFDGTLVHTDDFFLRPCQRTPERYRQPGGNVDYERLKEEVLEPLKWGSPFTYRPFDCGKMDLTAPVPVSPRRLRVIEGVYSMHPALRQPYDLTVFLTAPEKTRCQRILRRNGEEMARRFWEEWIPMEDRYFKAFGIREHCDLVIEEEEE